MSSFVLVVRRKVVKIGGEHDAEQEAWREERFTMGGKRVSFVIEVLKIL
jgi:hypothetical protein